MKRFRLSSLLYLLLIVQLLRFSLSYSQPEQLHLINLYEDSKGNPPTTSSRSSWWRALLSRVVMNCGGLLSHSSPLFITTHQTTHKEIIRFITQDPNTSRFPIGGGPPRKKKDGSSLGCFWFRQRFG